MTAGEAAKGDAAGASITGREGREAEVWRVLATVVDPELDEPVTDLRFVTSVAVGAAGEVAIGWRLPTYWCAANFAWLMADDMRRAVAGLPWAGPVTIVLDEHMYADAINDGVARGLSFGEAFAEEADGDDVESVRRTFLVKAFQRRQEALLRHLIAGADAEALSAVLALSVAELSRRPFEAEGAALVRRYLERRDVVGTAAPDAPAFVDALGAPLAADRLAEHLRALRSVAVNVEFNGALCRGLLAARYDEMEAAPALPERPELVDFVREVNRRRLQQRL